MKLNLDYYNENDENKINTFDYNKEENESLKNKISDISQNIINWYDFTPNSNILEINTIFNELTKMICEKAHKVVTITDSITKANKIASLCQDEENLEIIVGKFERIKINEKFDYIILIGSLPYLAKQMNMSSNCVLKIIKNYLNDNGKILIAVDNKFGIQFFTGKNEKFSGKKFVSLLGYNNEIDKIETYTKNKLQNIAEENEFKGVNFYYPLPDYRLPNVIFSEKELPHYNNVDEYTQYYDANESIIVNEIDLYREILKNDERLFDFFANSFLVELSNNVNPIKYKHITYNNMRKNKYKLITKITDEYVIKDMTCSESLVHYNSIIDNIKIIKDRNIDTVDEILENDKIRSRYIEHDNLLSHILAKKIEENNKTDFYEIIDKYYEFLIKSFEEMPDKKQNVFEKYGIEITENLKKELHFKKYGFWDMTFKNCFVINDKFYFFDQEWMEENVPVEYILYRSIMYTVSLRRFININEIINKYDFEKYLDIFQKLDEKIQQIIRDEQLWEFYNQKSIIDIDATKQEMINMQIRKENQELAMINLNRQIEELNNRKISDVIVGKLKKWIRRK